MKLRKYLDDPQREYFASYSLTASYKALEVIINSLTSFVLLVLKFQLFYRKSHTVNSSKILKT